MGEFEKLSSILNVSFEEVEAGESPNYEKYKQMILAFLRLFEPFFLRDKLFDNRLNRCVNALCGFGPVIFSPVDKTAKC